MGGSERERRGGWWSGAEWLVTSRGAGWKGRKKPHVAEAAAAARPTTRGISKRLGARAAATPEGEKNYWR